MKRGFITRIQQRTLSGLLFIVPITVTIAVAVLLVKFLQDVGEPLINRFYEWPIWLKLVGHRLEPIPGAKTVSTILVALLILYTIGWVSTTLVGKAVYAGGERLVLRIPLLKSIYTMSKQFVKLFDSTTSNNSFKLVARFEWPVSGSYGLGFVTGESRYEGDSRTFVHILMPTTPWPTPIYLIMIPAERVEIIDITVEEGLQIVLSAGVVVPAEMRVRPYLSLSAEERAKVEQTGEQPVMPPTIPPGTPLP